MPEHRDATGALRFQPAGPGSDFVAGIALAVVVLQCAIEHSAARVEAQRQRHGEAGDALRFENLLQGGNYLHAVMRERAVHDQHDARGAERLSPRFLQVPEQFDPDMLDADFFGTEVRRCKRESESEQRQRSCAGCDATHALPFEVSAQGQITVSAMLYAPTASKMACAQ